VEDEYRMTIDKRARFINLAEKRVNRALNDIRLIGNLSNRQNYVYTQEDAQKIISALESEVRRLKSRFAADAAETKSTFKF
jgi:hypothetical protein